MKKFTAILLALLLIAICAPALAANTDGLGDTVARNAELAAFLDGSGNIYVSGLQKPVNATKAQSLVSIDPYRILFFAQASAQTGVPQGRLISLALADGFTETAVTDDAYAACLDEENVYYISRANRSQLIRYNLDDDTSVVAFTAGEALERIYDSSIGVITTLIDGAGAYITDPITGQFIPYVGDAAREIAYGDDFEVYLTDSANLYVRQNAALNPTQVDSGVRAWAIIDRNLYYLVGSDGELSLKQYGVDSGLWNFVLSLPADMEPQLTASENSLFMLSSNNAVYSVDVAGRRLVNYATLPTLQSYALSGSSSLTGYRIEAVSGQLNIYGTVEDDSVQPTFTFVDFGAPSTLETGSEIRLLSAYAIDAESTVWDLLQPAAQYSPLRRGSRGDAVSAIQQPLYDLGYYNYYIDGIFGWRTERAVELLQDALGLRVTGVADEDLQRRILAGGLPAYDPYRSLERGDRGLRVTEMQQRLRDLGYLADDADGIFGPRTEAAVELFQSENGLSETGVASAETLRKLFSSSARTCSSYIELRRGDTGYRVRELNRRLKELYYLEGSAGSTYTAATAEAVRLFQQEAGLRQTGVATAAVQRELFSRNAPEYSGYVTLRRGDDNDRVLAMQRRLRKLGYYDGELDGYFGKGTYQAVRLFQRQAGLKVTGVADPKTLARLFAADAPKYQPPEKLTTPVIDFYGDSFETDKKGVYQVPAEVDALNFYWTAEGVDKYDISLSGDDELITSSTGTTDEMVYVSTARLRQGVVYTFTVVAHPIDKVNNDDASASLRFRIVPEPPTLESVKIDVKSNYKFEDGIYVIDEDALQFDWTARGGEVDRYEYTIADEGGEEIHSGEGESLDATDLGLSPDKIYALTVTAYPVGNDGGSVTDSIQFRVVAPEALATDTPEPTEEDGDDPLADGEDEEESEPMDGEPAPQGDAEESDPTGDAEEDADDPTNGAEDGVDDPTEGDGGEPGAEVESSSAPELQAGPSLGEVPMDVTQPDGSVATEQVVTVGEGSVQLSWATEGDVAGYNVRITDEAGNTMVDQNLTDTGATVDSAKLVPGEVYAMTATAFFNSGESTDSTLYFMKAPEEPEAPEEEPEAPEEEPEAPEEEPEAPEEEPEAPEEEPEAPEEEPEPEQGAPLGVPAVALSPAEGEVRMDVSLPGGGVSTETVVTVGEGSFELRWPAEGDVAGYQVTITDSNGNAMVDNRLTNTSANVNTQNLVPGEVYTMTVTAYSNGGDETVASLYFMKPAAEEPVDEPAEEESYDEETYDEPAEEESYDEETYDEPAEEESYDEETYDEPAEEESYDEETYDEPAEEESYDEETYDEPAEEEPYGEEPYEEEPYEEPVEEKPAAAESGEEGLSTGVDVTMPIDAESDSETITALQKRLRSWGWLEKGSFTKGELDEATVQAISDFQSYCFENGLDLLPIDPEYPIVETDTLNLLFNPDGNEITKP